AFEASAFSEEGPLTVRRRDTPAPRPLSRRFYARPSPVVARELLGRLLVRRTSDEVLVARIVETEAYQQDDPASHSFRGATARNGAGRVSGGVLWVGGGRAPDRVIRTGPRVGIRHAADVPWRFWVDGSPFVSGRRGASSP